MELDSIEDDLFLSDRSNISIIRKEISIDTKTADFDSIDEKSKLDRKSVV